MTECHPHGTFFVYLFDFQCGCIALNLILCPSPTHTHMHKQYTSEERVFWHQNLQSL